MQIPVPHVNKSINRKESSDMNTSRKMTAMTTTALMTAVLCILGPLAIPIGPIPISLTNLTLYFTLYAIGTKRGLAAYLIYLLLGLIGLPVFSGFSGGPQKLFGPTGGYLIGFIGMIVVAGIVIDHHYDKKIRCIAGMFIATLIPYMIGTAWLAYVSHITFTAAFAAGVAPFAAEDIVKMILAALIGPVLRTRLIRAGVFTYAPADDPQGGNRETAGTRMSGEIRKTGQSK